MKKILLVAAAALTLASCGSGNKADNATETEVVEVVDSAYIADSIAAAAKDAEGARLDSIRQDSIATAMFENALTVTPGKVKLVPIANTEGTTASLPVTITNNTDVTILAADYDVTYTEKYATCSDGSSPDGSRKNKVAGVDIEPGATATITLKGDFLTNIVKPAAKLKISKEELAKRRTEAKK